MALAGWRSRQMLSRYAKSAERARHRRRPPRERRRPAVRRRGGDRLQRIDQVSSPAVAAVAVGVLVRTECRRACGAAELALA